MMRFQHPEFAWVFLLLLVPILVHLLRFRKQQTRYFPGVFRLISLLKETQSTNKIKYYLLLANRLLLVFALAWVFAQPTCQNIPSNSANETTSLGVIWDASPSMWEADALGQVPIERAKIQALNWLKQLPETSSIYWVDNVFESEEMLTAAQAISRVRTYSKPLINGRLFPLFERISLKKSAVQWFVISDLDADIYENLAPWIDSQSTYQFVDFGIKRAGNYSLDTAFCSDALEGRYEVQISRNFTGKKADFFVNLHDENGYFGNRAVSFEADMRSVRLTLTLPKFEVARMRLTLPKDAYEPDNQLFLHGVNTSKIKVFLRSDGPVADLDRLLETLSDRLQRTDTLAQAQVVLLASSGNKKTDMQSVLEHTKRGHTCVVMPYVPDLAPPFNLLNGGSWERLEPSSGAGELDFKSFRQEPFSSSLETYLDGKNVLPRFDRLYQYPYETNRDWSRVLITTGDKDFLIQKEIGEGRLWLFLSDYTEGMREFRNSAWFVGVLGPILLSSHASKEAVCAFWGQEWISLPSADRFRMQDAVQIKKGDQVWGTSLGMNRSQLCFTAGGAEAVMPAGWIQIVKSDGSDSVTVAMNTPRGEQCSGDEVLAAAFFEADNCRRIDPPEWVSQNQGGTVAGNKNAIWIYSILLLLLVELILSVFVLRTNR